MPVEENLMQAILLTFGTAMVPVLELRGAIPVGVAAGLSPAAACLVSILGNMVPVPFILLLIRRIFDWLRGTRLFGPRIDWLERRAHLKGRMVRKYRLPGLIILVAIPLPGTGAWTGALVAALLDIRMRHALPAIFLGTILTHLCGGSAGREGAALQMGGTIGRHAGNLFNLDDRDLRTATMAGMAFGSAFLGMCHGMAHTIGALCHVAHGRTNSILLPYVIRYNGQIPEEPTSWPKYNKYIAPERYQDIARNLGIDTGKTPAEGVENLAKAVEDYRDNKLGMNKSFQECGVDEDYFWSVLDQIGMRAYEDQCTPANPRIPLINDMKDIAVGAYYGVSQAEGHKLRIEREGEAATEEASER